MQIEWIKGSDKRRLLLFFNGWGMEAQAVAHLQGEADVTEAESNLNASMFQLRSFLGSGQLRSEAQVLIA